MPVPQLLDLLEDGASPDGCFVFDDGHAVSGAELWKMSERAAVWLRNRVGPGETVAMILTASPYVLAALLGAMRAGTRIASFPHPARAMSGDAYLEQLSELSAAVSARLLVVEGMYRDLLMPRLRAEAAEVVVAGRAHRVPDAEPATFVQFSSGTTGCPKGVVLTGQAIAANLLAMIEILDPIPGDTMYSWLPLSHDLGLFGTFLGPWVAAAPRFAGGGTTVLSRPESFLADPTSWLLNCARFGATVTAAPPFALDLVARRLAGHLPPIDLSRLRMLLLGGEPVRPATLRRFASATNRHRLDERVLCPAYGLAEATLGVTAVRPGEGWSSAVVDGVERVSCGRPLPGVHIDVVDGEIRVRTDGACSGYADGRSPFDGRGRICTGDLGHLDTNGALYVVGRTDDLMTTRGRNIAAQEVEDAANGTDGVRTGTAVAFVDDEGTLVVVAEPQTGIGTFRQVPRAIRLAVTRTIGISPLVILCKPNSVPKTPSGKLKRHAALEQYRDQALSVVTTSRAWR